MSWQGCFVGGEEKNWWLVDTWFIQPYSPHLFAQVHPLRQIVGLSSSICSPTHMTFFFPHPPSSTATTTPPGASTASTTTRPPTQPGTTTTAGRTTPPTTTPPPVPGAPGATEINFDFKGTRLFVSPSAVAYVGVTPRAACWCARRGLQLCKKGKLRPVCVRDFWISLYR